MASIPIIAGTICLLAWLYLLCARGSFWRVGRLGATTEASPRVSGTIAVVIPARDEADVVGQSVSSLLAQTCAESLRIIVVDDQSSDGTADVVREAAQAAGRPQAVEVIQGDPLPAGWTGKLWAVQQGVRRAMEFAPAFLLLTDADIRHSHDSIATLVAIAESGPYDLTSFMVKLHCETIAEKLLIPAFVFFFFMLYPPEWTRDPRRATAGAAGGCMLVRPAALEKAGGIAAIRQEIIDDCALARAIKLNGGHVWLGLAPDTVSTRVYATFGDVERMISRTAFKQLRHSAFILFGSLLGLAVTYLVPWVLILSGHVMLAAVGVVCWLLMTIAYAPMVRYYGRGPQWALTLPASASFYMFATLHSAIKYWSGRGGEWKGRAQDR
jgi:hopene-associated glycosyltransferase HpnB